MAALPAIPRWTVSQYLEMEEYSPDRHEYVAGIVYPLAGSTLGHSLISVNIITLLLTVLRGGPCRVYPCSLKTRATPECFLYPDVSINCDPADQRGEALWIEAPRVVVEVMSDSTADYDRSDKSAFYQANAALRDYVLVETRRWAIEVRSRQDDGQWTTRTFGPGEPVVLPSLAVELPMAAIYEDTDVPAVPSDPNLPTLNH